MGIGRAAGRLGLGALILVALVAVWATRSVLPAVLRHVVQRQVALQADLALQLDDLSVSLLPPRVTATALSLSRHGEPLLSARRIDVRLAPLRSLWAWTWIGDVEVDEPKLVVDDRTQSWKDLSAALHAGTAGPSGEAGVLPRNLVVRSGTVELRLSSREGQAVFSDVNVRVRLAGIVRRHADFDVTLRAAIDRAARRLEVTRISARGRVSTDGLVIEAGLIEGAPGFVRMSGGIDDHGGLRGRVEADVALEPIFALVPEAGHVSGGGRISLDAAGTTAQPEMVAELNAVDVRIHDVEFSGRGRLVGRRAEWSLADAQVRIFGGDVRGEAHGTWLAPIPFEATGRFSGWDPAVFVSLFGARVPIGGKWDGEARLGGNLLGMDLHGGGDFSLERSAVKLEGAASFSVAHNHVAVEAHAQAGTDASLRARYEVADRAISGRVAAEGKRLGVLGSLVGLDLDAAGAAQAEFAGSVAQPRIAGRVDLGNVAGGGLALGAVRGPFEISRGGLQTSKLELADGEIELAGRVALTASQENRWSAVLHRASLSRAVPALRLRWPAIPEVGGILDARAQGSGSWTALRVAANGRVAAFQLAGQSLGDGPFDVAIDGARSSGSVNLRRDDGATSALNAVRDRDGRLNARVAAAGWHLERVEALRSRVAEPHGSARLEGSVGGTLARPTGEASLIVAELGLAGRRLGDARLTVRSAGDDAVGDLTLDHLRASANAAVRPPHRFRAHAEWSALDLAPFVSAVPGATIRTAGNADLRGDAERPFGQGEALVTELAFERGAYRLRNRAPLTLRIADGVVDVPDAVFAGDGQELVVGGRWSRGAASFHGSGTGDLELLEQFSAEVASARGQVTAELGATRNGDEPWRYRGRMHVDGAALDLAFLVGVTEIRSDVLLEDRRIELRDLSGKLAGGDFRIHGTAALDGDWNLDWLIRDASFGVPSWLDYRATGHGRIVGPLAQPTLGGEVDVSQALYDRRIEWTEFLPWFRRQGTQPGAAGVIPIAIDLHVIADGGLFIDNNLAKVEMRTDLKLRGGGADGGPLAWSGSLDVLDGEFYFRRRRFTITSGAIRFHENRSTNPDLQFSGETRVTTRDEEYEILVRVTGSADEPRIRFTADDPTLTEADVLALVTFGRTVAQLQSQGAGIELADVLALTAGPEAGTVEKRLHTFLPVDRIEIEPSFSRVNGVNEPRLSVAKEVTERLSAIVGSGLGAERRQNVGLEYQFTRRFSLQGDWESQTKSEAGAFGANLKFRVPFRALPRFSLLAGSP